MNAMTCLETLSREGAGNDPSGRRQSARPTSERSSRATTNAHSHHNGKKMSGGLAGTNETNRSFSSSAQGWSKPGNCAGNWTPSADGGDLSASAGQFPERAPHPPRSRVIEPYLDYLRQRWEQGEHNGRLLFEEIRAQGYPAGLTEVYVAIQPWRTHGPTASLARAQEVQQYPSYSRHPNLMVAFQRKTNGQRATVCAEPAGAE